MRVDIIISNKLIAPHETALHIAKVAQEKRLSLNLSQQTLSDRSGVSFGVIKKFERTGRISLESLLKIAVILESLDGFAELFPPKKPQEFVTLDALMKDTKRKRGRQ